MICAFGSDALRIGHGQLGTAKIRRIDAGFMKW
jgi:hypothetical protein